MAPLPKRNVREIKQLLRGRIKTSAAVLKRYAHDASLFEIKPQLVAYPKDVADVSALVNYVRHQRRHNPQLSLTARSGGTDMSGGAINDSIIVDFSKYFNRLGKIKGRHLSAQPGVYYRNFEQASLLKNLIMPAYPASRQICMIGGMVANNSGGEKSLSYGKVEDYVSSIKAVLCDGREYTFGPLNRQQLKAKMQQSDLEGQIYRQIYRLLADNYAQIKSARPRVSKDATGYHLYRVWNQKTFDLTQLLVGSQGTLGLVTEATFKLIPVKNHSRLLVAFLPDLTQLGQVINIINTAKPTSFESFDDHTLRFALRFLPYFRKSFGWWGFLRLGFQLLPELRLFIKGFPKLIILVEFEGDTTAAVQAKITALIKKLKPFDISLQVAETPAQARKFWLLRRESFNILRHNVKNKHAAPFIDDIIVPPAALPEFLPRLRQVLAKYDLTYTIAGHLGDGNFHIIPLMTLQDATERAKIEPLRREVNHLVIDFGGSISAEHNDGLVRGDFLETMHGSQMYSLFKEVKQIFDPQHIFNPHKKTDATWEYSAQHLRRRF